jgi:hypothetical protein
MQIFFRIVGDDIAICACNWKTLVRYGIYPLTITDPFPK